MVYDVAKVRSYFPACAEGAAHFDGPGGSQTPIPVADAVRATMLAATANHSLVTVAERRATATVTSARRAAADLVGGHPRGIVFGRSATQLTYDFARTLAKQWRQGDEVVVTRLDHDSNVRPWIQAAEAVGATARFADFDPATGEMTADHIAAAITGRTRVVAVTAASNLIGTRPPIERIAEMAHEVGALLWVDGVHASAHVPVDVAALGADVWTCSPYKFLGPHCGILAAAPSLLETLHPDKLLPSSNDVPDRFELGTLPYELLAGVTAAVDFLAWFADTSAPVPAYVVPDGGPGDPTHTAVPDEPAVTERRARVLAGARALEAHEEALLDLLEPALRDLPGVRVFSNAASRTPTLLFDVAGRDSQQVRAALAEEGVNVPASAFYALECSRRLGLGDTGALRAGLAPYTDADDVQRLLVALRSILRR